MRLGHCPAEEAELQEERTEGGGKSPDAIPGPSCLMHPDPTVVWFFSSFLACVIYFYILRNNNKKHLSFLPSQFELDVCQLQQNFVLTFKKRKRKRI